jgi:hypothetical protein
MEDDQLVSVTRQRCVEQFARKRPTMPGDDEEGLAELASLRLMNGQRIGEF